MVNDSHSGSFFDRVASGAGPEFSVKSAGQSVTLRKTGGDQVKRKLKIGLWLFGALLAAGLVFWLWTHYRGDVSLLTTTRRAEQAIASLRSYGPLEVALFLGLLIIMCCVPGAPSSVVAIFTGVCLGHWVGFLVSAAGLTAGNLLQSALLQLLADRQDRTPNNWLYQALIAMKHPRIGLLIGYAVPMIPNMLINMAAARLNVDRRSHAAVCLAGSTLVAALYAFGGDALIRGNRHTVIGVVVLLIALSGLILVIRSDRKRRRDAQA